MKHPIYLFLFLLLLACKYEKSFKWSKELKQQTGGHLETWLEKAPFNNKWDYKEKDKIVFTNINQVFPFLGKLINENNDFDDYNDIYKKETIVFKDTILGESFVYAALLYEPEEIFVEEQYYQSGNIMFSGLNATNESYTAYVSETKLHENNSNYKTAIYWVNSNTKKYLMGWYQNKNLLFQFAFPCTTDEKSKGLKKIKEINLELNLNIKEWARATESDLEINRSPQTFWKDPYYDLYREKFIPQLKLKLKNTQYERLRATNVKGRPVDYLFAYEDTYGQHTISLQRVKTDLNQEKYEEKLEGLEYLTIEGLITRKLFLREEKNVNKQIISTSEIYFKDNSILTIEASYPKKDVKAKERLIDVLQHLDINDL